jgi:hypothetical protein|tara:strand:- start:2986 stop:3714 length:729 start_codon:yes stop_codon:yes gene_type:complete
MSYLYVDGCSFTRGTGLDIPKDESWGPALGNKLELPVENYSYNGQGNDEMFRRVYELFYFNKPLPSIIVIQLSELTRIKIYDDIRMGWISASYASWDYHKERRDTYFKYYYSIHQNLYYLFVQMLLLKDKCDSLGIKFYVFDGICDINLHCLSKIKNYKEKRILLDLYQAVKDKNFLLYNGDYSWNQIKSSEYDFKKGHELFWKDRSGQPKKGEWALNCDHPTKESHEFMANELYNFIKESK